jgi:predicted ester cyclase
MQQGERNRNTVLRFFNEVMALGSLEVLDELAVDDYEDHVALPGQGPGRAGLKQRVATIRAAFEPRQELHDVIVDGDRVAVRWTLRGTHSGPFIGMPAARRPVEFDGVDLYAMRDGRMAAHWNVVGLWAFYQQVGGTVIGQHDSTGVSD